MRYVFVVLLSAVAVTSAQSRNILSNVRPHIRLLVQAVASSGPGPFKDYRSKEVGEGTFCQAATSLVDSKGNPITGLFSTVRAIAVTGAETTRIFLQNLGNAFRGDDLRRALDMQKAWDNSIIAEIDIVAQGIARDIEYHAEEKDKKFETPKEVQTHLGEGKQFQVSGNDQYRLSESEQVKFKAHHKNALKSITELGTTMEELRTNLKNVFTAHVTSVVKNKDYKVKWGPELVDAAGTATTADFESFLTEIFKQSEELRAATKGGDGGATGKESQDSTSDQYDKFNAGQAVQVGSTIVSLIAQKDAKSDHSKNSLSVSGNDSPAKQLDILTTKLNVLTIRKMALIDAEKSLNDLLNLIRPIVAMNQVALSEKLSAVKEGLKELVSLANAVYTDVARYPTPYNVKIEYDGGKDLYDSYVSQVGAAKEDAIAQNHARINLLVNVAFRVHGHMLAFVKATAAPGVQKNSVKSNIDTTIAEFKSVSGEVTKKSGEVTNESGEVTKNSGEVAKQMIAEFTKNARKASQCLLYGRYDVLMQKLKVVSSTSGDRTETADLSDEGKWCKDTHEVGIVELRDSRVIPQELETKLTASSISSGADESAK